MDPIKSTFELYEEVLDTVLLDISGSDVKILARHLGGAGGPVVAYAKVFKESSTRFSSESEHLREELFHCSEWLANKTPPWAAIRVTMACHLVYLDKAPGVLPVIIGEIIRRLLTKCFLLVTVTTATDTYSNPKLCDGSVSGKEGASVHATLENYIKELL